MQGPLGSGQAGAALGDFLRGAQILAASEALRIGQRFGLDAKSVIEIGEMLSGVGPAMGAMLREQVLTRRFDTGLALGHVLEGLEVTASVAQSTGVHAPLLAACRAAWAAAEAGNRIGCRSERTDPVAGIRGGAGAEERGLSARRGDTQSADQLKLARRPMHRGTKHARRGRLHLIPTNRE